MAQFDGGLTFPFCWTGAERLLKHALGAVGTTGAGPYVHLFNTADALPVGLTIRVNRDAALTAVGADVYTGCQVQKFTLKQSIEDYLTCSVDLVGKDRTTAADSSPTYTVFDPIDWEMLTTCSFAAVDMEPEEIELVIENALATDRFKLGSLTRKGFGRNGERKVSVKITTELTSAAAAILAAYYSNLEDALALAWTSTGGKSLEIDLPKVRLVGEPPTVKDKGPIKVTLQFEGYMDAAEGDEIAITLTNDTATI